MLVITIMLPLHINCVFSFDSFTNTIPATELIGGTSDVKSEIQMASKVLLKTFKHISSLCWLPLQRENVVWPSIDAVRDVLWLLRHVRVLRALENLARGERVRCLVASVAWILREKVHAYTWAHT